MICFAGCVVVNCRGRPPCLPEQLAQIPIIDAQTRGSAPTVGCNAIRMANSKLSARREAALSERSGERTLN